MQSIKFALRQLMKSPSFTLIATLTLALGIGANSAIFSVINAVVLNPFPYPEARNIVQLGQQQKQDPGMMPLTYPDFLEWRAQSRAFENIAWISGRNYVLTGQQEPVYLRTAQVTADIWPLLRMQPVLGRVFDAAQDKLGAARTVVLSYALWRDKFGADPKILGQSITLDGTSFTAIGVMPPSFRFWNAQAWIPAGLSADQPEMRSRVTRNDSWGVGRLATGVSLATAMRELEVISTRLEKAFPATNENVGASGSLLIEMVSGQLRPTLLILFGAVFAVLLIACLNVANLLLARHAARERELSVRTALGASRWRVIRQLLLENVPLAILGGLAGVVVSYLGLQILLSVLPTDILPSEANIKLDGRVLVFTAVLSLATVLIFGLIASLGGVHTNPMESLRGMAVAGNRRGSRLRATLIVTEIALAFVLLACSALLVRSFDRMVGANLGFDADNVLLMPVSLPQTRYPQPAAATQFFDDLVQRTRALPGVKLAAAATVAPMMGANFFPLLTEGVSYPTPAALRGVSTTGVSGDYFATLGLKTLQGRVLRVDDNAASEQVIVLNETAARQVLRDLYALENTLQTPEQVQANTENTPLSSVLNKRVMLGVPDHLRTPELILPEGVDNFKWARVVGVVNDMLPFGPQNEAPRAVYVPITQLWAASSVRNSMTLMLKTQTDPNLLVKDTRALLFGMDATQPSLQLITLAQLIRDGLSVPRFTAMVLSTFGALALLLASIGVYGIVAWNLSQRTREVGIRIALGAPRSSVTQLLLKQGMRVVALGLVLGAVGAVFAVRLTRNVLFEVGELDVISFTVVPIVLASVAALACWLPTRKIAKLDAIKSLRSE
jgi:putative ABC transport system permease protein